MNRLNKKGDLMTFVVPLIVVLVVAVIIILFNQNSIGLISNTLKANDPVVMAAAAGCDPGISVGIAGNNKFCHEFKEIKQSSMLSTKSHYVNCNYLNDTIRASIPNVGEYNSVGDCINATRIKCDLLLAENQDNPNYKVLINGVSCSKTAVIDSTK